MNGEVILRPVLMSDRGRLLRLGSHALLSGNELREHPCGLLQAPLCVGEFRHENLVVSSVGADASCRNILGLGFLRRYVVIFDFPRRRVYLKPGKEFQNVDALNDLGGVRMRRENGRIVVSGVGWKCPASSAGLHEGDELVFINGKTTSLVSDLNLISDLSARRGASMVFRRPAAGGLIHYEYKPAGPAANYVKEN